MTVALEPSSFRTARMVVMFVAGPPNRNAKIAPGNIPFANKTAAIGVDDVAHT